MGTLLLSTLKRAQRYANKQGANSGDTSSLLDALAAASTAMQSYCSMQWYRKTEEETRQGNANGIIMLRSWPVTSIASVGILRRGSLAPQMLSSSQYALFDDNELHLPPAGPLDRYILKYVGGIAESTTVSVEEIESYTGTITAGDTFSSNSAAGSIKSIDLTAMTVNVDVADGTLSPGDVLAATTAGWTLSLGDTITPSIVSDYSDLATACDQQATYIYQRRNTPGRTVVQGLNGTSNFEAPYKLLDGVKEILEYYDHQYLG